MCKESITMRRELSGAIDNAIERFREECEPCPNDGVTMAWLMFILNVKVLPAEFLLPVLLDCYKALRSSTYEILTDIGESKVNEAVEMLEDLTVQLERGELAFDGILISPAPEESENDALDIDDIMRWLLDGQDDTSDY